MSEQVERTKCEVHGKIIEPCKFLYDACEFGNPTGKKKGVFCWDLFKLTDNGRENTRRLFGVKSGDYVDKGLIFTYCPFCGEKHHD